MKLIEHLRMIDKAMGEPLTLGGFILVIIFAMMINGFFKMAMHNDEILHDILKAVKSLNSKR